MGTKLWWLLLVPLSGYAQDGIPSRKTLLNSPTHITCDSLGMMYVQGSFWRNKMPLADNNILNWSCYVASGDSPLEDRSCATIIYERFFFLYAEEVLVFHVSSTCKYGEPKVYTAPDFVVIEYRDQETGKLAFIRSTGSLKVCADVD